MNTFTGKTVFGIGTSLKITALPGYEPAFSSPFFDEFVIKAPISPEKLEKQLEQAGILGGYPLAKSYPGLDNHILFCVTETRTKDEIDLLVSTLKEVQA